MKFDSRSFPHLAGRAKAMLDYNLEEDWFLGRVSGFLAALDSILDAPDKEAIFGTRGPSEDAHLPEVARERIERLVRYFDDQGI